MPTRSITEFFPSLQTHQESVESMRCILDHFCRHEFGLWAVEVIDAAPFVGFVGLSVPSFDAPFMPCVELGYRLAFEHWGRGYATEGARAAIAFGFATLGLAEIVAMTAVGNERSRRRTLSRDIHYAALQRVNQAWLTNANSVFAGK